MANEDNLKGYGFHERTASEQRAIASKGGKASGKARRKRADLRKALNTVLTAKVPYPQLAKMLEDMGFENSFETAIAFSMANEAATKGNVRAAEWISKLTTNEKDELDRKEQQERIKQLKHDNSERAKNTSGQADSIVIVDAWANDVEGAADDI
ncbi:TPA: stress-induced protein [Streptococcus suis]|nr:stress-induced protein [Streptococcus suis]